MTSAALVIAGLLLGTLGTTTAWLVWNKWRQRSLATQPAKVQRPKRERRRAENARRDCERLLRLGQRIVQTGSWERDFRSGQVRWSDETYRIFGFAPGGVKTSAMLFFERVHPDDRERVMREFGAVVEQDAPRHITLRIVRGDDSERIVRRITAVFRDDAGKRLRLVGVIRDITEQQQAQEELRLSRERFFNILNMAPDAIVTIDDTQRIVMYNRGAQRIFGYTPEEAVGQHLELLIPARLREAHAGHLEGFHTAGDQARQGPQHGPVFGLRKDGSEFPAEVSISKMHVRGGGGGTVILRDITRRVATEQALGEANARLESRVAERVRSIVSVFAARAGAELERMQARIELVAANQEQQQILDDLKHTQMQLIQSEKMGALGQLVAGIAHEINTPSGAIKNSVKEIEHDDTALLEHMLGIVGRLSSGELELYLHACRAAIDQCRGERPSTRQQRQAARGLRKLLVPAAVVGDAVNVASRMENLTNSSMA